MARECTCCKAERKSNGKAPRNLITLPRVVTMDKTTFRKPMASVFLCEFCDGEAASEAIKHADKL